MINNLGKVLKQRFPTASVGVGDDYVLQDDSDGKGPYIAKWDEKKLGKQPSDAQLSKWIDEFQEPPPLTEEDKIDAMLALHGVTPQAFKERLSKVADRAVDTASRAK